MLLLHTFGTLGPVELKVQQSNLERYPMMCDVCDEKDKGCKAQKPVRKVEAVGELSKVFQKVVNVNRFPGVLGRVRIAKKILKHFLLLH